jgi:hypothetical protein
VFTILNATFTNQTFFEIFAEKESWLIVYQIQRLNTCVHYGELPIEPVKTRMVHLLHPICRAGVHNTEHAGCAGAGTFVPSRSDAR